MSLFHNDVPCTGWDKNYMVFETYFFSLTEGASDTRAMEFQCSWYLRAGKGNLKRKFPPEQGPSSHIFKLKHKHEQFTERQYESNYSLDNAVT